MSSPTPDEHADMKQQAITQLAQGKRHLMVKDYSEAVTSLALACEYFAKIYGDLATECGEAYYNYGKALLELSRTETGVLGSAMEDKDGSTEDSDSEEKNEVMETVPEDGNGDKIEKKNEVMETVPEDSNGDKIEEKNENGGEVLEKTGDVTEVESEDKGEDNEEENEEEDVTNLNLAWDILELAKVIYQRQAENDSSYELKLAEVSLKLGEVSLESENYVAATEDMKICLSLQKKNLPEDNREIAETYYQIGVANSLANQFDDAIEAFANCGKLLELRISNLKELIKADAKPDTNDPFYSFQGEIEELEKLFPEIKEKIFDMQDFKNETMKAMVSQRAETNGAGSSKDADFPQASSSTSTSQQTAISNIGHLVRKKRKEPEQENEDPKRQCKEI